MKKFNKLFLVLMVVFGFTACDELLDDIISFDSDFIEFDFTINPTNDIGEKVVHIEVISSDFEEILEDNDLDKDNISSVLVKEAFFEVTNPDQQVNFNGISAVSTTVKAGTLSEVVIAEKDPMPADAREVELDVISEDLEKYLDNDQYSITAKAVIDEPLTDTIFVLAKIKYTIKGGL
ncbi:MAG: hypothetical protein ACOC4J_00900 [Bacteroidota bacterium]